MGDAIAADLTSFNSPDLYTVEYAETASAYADEMGGLFDTAHANGYVAGELIARAAADAGSTAPRSQSTRERTLRTPGSRPSDGLDVMRLRSGFDGQMTEWRRR